MSRPTRRSCRRCATGSASGWATPPPSGLPELREAVAGWVGAPLRRRSRPGDCTSSRRSARRRRSSRSPRSCSTCPAAATPSSSPSPATRSRGAVRRSPARGSSSFRSARTQGFLPALDDVPDERLEPHGARLAQLAEQPDRSGRAALVPRAACGARARARLRARLRRGVHGALVRRAAALRAPARRPDERRRVQHALEALVDDRLPERLRRRRSGARRGAPPVPAERRHRAAGVRPARLGGRLGRRGARRARTGDVPAQARRCCSTSCAARASATRAAPRRCTSGSPSRTARRPRVTRRASSSVACS